MNRRIGSAPFITLIVLMVSLTSAKDSLTVASVAAGGMTHLLVYPLADDSHAKQVEAALPTIITAYETLWNAKNAPMPFQLLIDTALEPATGDDLSDTAFESVMLPVPSAPAEWEGATENAPTNTCHIQLFDAPVLGESNRLEFELALGVARCYLLHAISAEPQDWWFNGLAYWMALQVYSPPQSVLDTIQKDYQDGYNGNVLNGDEEAVYFWEFLLGANIANPPFNDLPTLALSFGSTPQQFLPLTPDLFYAYANVVDQDLLPWQPAADDLADEADLSGGSLSADISLDLEENAIYITKVTLPELEEGQGVTITGQDLANSGTIAAVGGDGSFVQVADDVPLDLCGETEFTVLAGRAAASDPDSVSLGGPSLTVSLKESCTKAKIPACMVGTWQQDVPNTGTYVSTDGQLQHTYRADGTFSQNYTNYVVTFNLPDTPQYDVTYITTAFTGSMTTERDPKTPGRYIVKDWQRQMDAGGNVVMNRDGKTIDVTSAITMEYFGDGIPSYYVCDKDNAQNTHFTGYVAGKTIEALGATTYTFTRVP